MRILSWDVGLKTLSYCLLRVERVANTAVDEGKTQCIVERWETIDVPSEYFVRVDPVQCQPVQCQPVKGPKRAKRTVGETPLAITITETRVLPRKRAVRPPSAVTKKLTLEQSVEAVHQSLARRVSFLLCEGAMPDAITIEQQPAGGHNRFSSVNMKVISHVIQAYFYNLVDTGRCTISFVSPASKLVDMRESDRQIAAATKKAAVVNAKMDMTVTTITNQTVENTGLLIPHTTTNTGTPLTETKTRTLMGQRYRKNKQFAVSKTHELIDNDVAVNGYAVEVLKTAGKKKDDLCDAFLLGYYYGIKHL